MEGKGRRGWKLAAFNRPLKFLEGGGGKTCNYYTADALCSIFTYTLTSTHTQANLRVRNCLQIPWPYGHYNTIFSN